MKSRGNRAEQRRRYKKRYPEKVKAEKKRYQIAHPEKGSAYMKLYNEKLRLEVLRYYSNDTLKCNYCGETHIEFLEIDHVHGNGKQHKREIKCYGISLYRWLKNNNFPPGFQVLCSNCNIKKVKDAARLRGETGTEEQRKYYM